jgi:hypothetical protein
VKPLPWSIETIISVFIFGLLVWRWIAPVRRPSPGDPFRVVEDA